MPDHLPVDAAALLGAGALPRRGLRPRRPADAAGDARHRVHPAAGAALHAGAVRGDAAALHLRHERLDLPGGGRRAGRRVHAATLGGCGAATATRWRAGPSASRSCTCRCCSRRCCSTTTCCPLDRHDPTSPAVARRWPLCRGAGRLRPAAGVAAPQGRASRRSTSPAPSMRAGSSCPTSTASRARWPTSRARSRWCSSASRNARTCARPRWPSWRRSSGRSAPTATGCRACSSRVDPERDTPAILKAYVADFDPSFVALRGTPEQTAAAAKEFKVFYRQGAGQDARAATRWTTPPAPTSSTPHGRVAAVHALRQRRRRHWPATSGN